MSSIVQKQLFSFARKPLFSRYLFEATNLRNGVARCLHQASSKGILRQEYPRTASPSAHLVHTVSQPTWITSKDESRELMGVWPDVVRDLTDATRCLDMPDVTKWLTKVLQYNVPGGKKVRALVCVSTYRALVPRHEITDENIRLIRILAWCMELLQAYLLINDDIQDGSTSRRNQPCWYLHEGIGLAATNDSLLMQSCIYQLLRKHFKQEDCYLDLVELFLDASFKTEIGQCLDLLSSSHGKKPNLDLFTMDRYNSIVKYKTAYYTFVLPVMAAMYFAGMKDHEMHRQSKTILLEMGHFFQVQDDYLDVYGDQAFTGKDSTDIEEGKCSWLVVVALQRVTPQQRRILEECYGVKDPEKAKRVKQLYDELGLRNMYSIYEEETYNLLNTHIQQISRGLPHDLFLKLLEKTYRKVV